MSRAWPAHMILSRPSTYPSTLDDHQMCSLLMLEGAGFEVRDLGVDVPPEKFVEAISAGNVDIVALSALLTTTMPYMKTTIEAIEQAGLRNQVKIIVGGAPVTQEFANQIGADGFSADASSAPGLAQSLL